MKWIEFKLIILFGTHKIQIIHVGLYQIIIENILASLTNG